MADEVPAPPTTAGAAPATPITADPDPGPGPEAILADLRDIHLPENPDSGGLARILDTLPADAALAPLALYVLACLLVWLAARHRRHRWRREARLEIGRLERGGAGLEAWIDLRRRVIESGRLHGGGRRATAPLPASAFRADPASAARTPIAALRDDILARLRAR